jgi:hypothetical protein
VRHISKSLTVQNSRLNLSLRRQISLGLQPYQANCLQRRCPTCWNVSFLSSTLFQIPTVCIRLKQWEMLGWGSPIACSINQVIMSRGSRSSLYLPSKQLSEPLLILMTQNGDLSRSGWDSIADLYCPMSSETLSLDTDCLETRSTRRLVWRAIRCRAISCALNRQQNWRLF